MKAAAQFVALCWVIVVAFWIASAFSVKATKERQPFLGRLIYLWVICAALLLFNTKVGGLALHRSLLPQTLFFGILADVIVMFGLVIAIWARSVLGANWSSRVVLKQNHELIQRGPYRFVRHPIYSGLLLMIFGTAVLAGRLGGFIALVISFFGLWLKLHQEEVLLGKHFPEYLEYKSRTKALIPFVL